MLDQSGGVQSTEDTHRPKTHTLRSWLGKTYDGLPVCRGRDLAGRLSPHRGLNGSEQRQLVSARWHAPFCLVPASYAAHPWGS